jgi:hypothetical protein
MFLNWITRLIKTAVLRGFHEAVEELDLAEQDAAPDATLAALKGRMTALPATLPSPSPSPSSNGGRVRRKGK